MSTEENIIISVAEEEITACPQQPDVNDCCIRQGTREDLLKLKILWELLAVLPADPASYNMLDKSICEDNAVHTRFITAIIDGEEVLVDGFRRADIICKHPDRNFTFEIKTLGRIHTLEQATDWVIGNSRTYRQLNKPYRVKFSLRIRKVYKERAKENQRRGGRKKALSKTDKAHKKTDCWGLLAKDADVSRQFAVDAAYVFDNGTAQEQETFCKKNLAASTMRKQIEKRKKPQDKPPVIYVNPERGKYVGEIIQGDCLKVLDDMHFDGINDVVILIVSPRYNVGLDYGSSCSDDTPYEEYLEFLSKMIYKAQLIGRDGMRICINCTDTYNKNSREDGSNLMHNIVHDLSSKVDALNKKYPNDCNLLYWGNFHWYKQNSNVIPFLGSYQAPVLKCDAENILVWMKNQRKLVPQNGINCEPHNDNIFSDASRNEYIITKEQYIEWTYQTWKISARTDDVDHPAKFPYEIPHRLIKMFTYPRDGIVLDCCVGSGTVCEEAVRLQRDFVGIDISSEYCDIAKARVKKAASRIKQ